jgi:hypothetical protein
VGTQAGQVSQGASTVAIGNTAGYNAQGSGSVAIGWQAGQADQGTYAVAVGKDAGYNAQGTYSVAVGVSAGCNAQGESATAVGQDAGMTSQGTKSVAVGYLAGYNVQGANCVAIGDQAGCADQGAESVAIGYVAAETSQGAYATAIGGFAGYNAQGNDALAVGYAAGKNGQHANSTVLNASGLVLNSNGTSRLFIKPIRLNSGALSWLSNTGEVYANTSDDRVKHNETYIRNALRTIMKLKPQTYDKSPDLESNTYIERHESGLMVQDIWYDVPEMRHIINLSQTAVPTPEKPPAPSDDPRDDPDYSAWGTAPSSLNYEQVVPFLVKAVQEVAVEVPRARTTVSNTWGQNITGLVVSANTNKHKTNTVPMVNLSTVSMDKSWYGVVSNEKTDSTDYDTLVDIKGDSRLWVTDTNGPLESGDLITTSNVATGYAQKQGDDIVRNYTIGKITQDCDFTEPTTITLKVPKQELSNVTYYIYQEKMNIDKKEYDFIGKEENKTTGYITMYRKNETDVEIHNINQEKYDKLDSSEQEEYESYQQLNYYRLDNYETKFSNQLTNKMHTIEEIRQELVDVLDENEQTVWEETDETRPVYTLVDHGTHKAALLTCKLF